MAIQTVGIAGSVVGADISLEMLKSARVRLNELSYLGVNADGQALPFKAQGIGV
jgi:ubiquinone/menaquinone biosynthesis C-methylase UbiE